MSGVAAAVLVALAVALWTGMRIPMPRVRLPHRHRAGDAAAVWVRAVDAMADELRAGSSVVAAYEQARIALQLPVAGQGDGSYSRALGAQASDHGLPELAHLGMALDAASSSGAGLLETLDHIADSLRDRIEDRALVAQEMASTKATVVVLACLPLVGALMAAALGGQSTHWLVSTGLGRMCLCAGVTLQAVGVWWVGRLVQGLDL